MRSAVLSTLAKRCALPLGVLGLLGPVGCGSSSSSEGPADATGDTADLDGAGRDALDGSARDAPPDAIAPSSDASDAALSCPPGDVSGYAPSWHPPNPPQSRCTSGQLDALFSNCLGPSTSQAGCDAFRTANAPCYACVVTQDTDSTWGPTVVSSKTMLYYGNFGGCVALLTGDPSATGCGAKIQAADVCAQTACGAGHCAAQTPSDLAALNACQEQAVATGCASYGTAEATCLNDLTAAGDAGAGAVRACRLDTYADLATYARALANLFCDPQADAGPGTGARDAGTGD